MNKARRSKLSDAIIYMTNAKNIIVDVKNEEEFAYDNLPENLQCSNKGYNMEENVDNMEEIIEQIDNIISTIEDVKF